MRILVTGARGKVGAATVDALHDAGHEVTASDLGAPVFEAALPGRRTTHRPTSPTPATRSPSSAATTPSSTPRRSRTRSTTRRTSCSPTTCMATFNALEAAVRFGVPRFVNVSSETVPGFFFPERPFDARLRADRRGAPDPPAGPVRARPSTSASS